MELPQLPVNHLTLSSVSYLSHEHTHINGQFVCDQNKPRLK